MPPRKKADDVTLVPTPKHFSELCGECGQSSAAITNAKGEPVLDASGNEVRHTHFACAHGAWYFDDTAAPDEE